MIAPLLLAHRGDHRIQRENTLAALRAALVVPRIGGVELDVRASKDGLPVVAHDERLERVFARPDRVEDLDGATLAAIGLPILDEVLEVVRPPAWIDVELKTAVIEPTLTAIRASRGDPPEALVLSSFEPGILRAIAATASAWPRWLNVDVLDDPTLALAQELGCSAVSVALSGLTPGGVERARARGLDVAVWTARTRSELEAALAVDPVAVCMEGEALGGYAEHVDGAVSPPDRSPR